MRNYNTLVLNLATGSEQTFSNALSPIENLISAYMVENKLSTSLHAPIARDRLRSKILYGKTTAGLGDMAVKI